MNKFIQRKLNPKKDKSIKNSYDEPIISIIKKINSKSNYNTLSSCSGRICIYSEQIEKLVYTTHDYYNLNLFKHLNEINFDFLYFKFEPLLLHVECIDLESAKLFFNKIRSKGFRNSGISISKRIIVELRNTLKLDVPVKNKKILINEEYCEYLKKIANLKMKKNFEFIKKLEEIIDEL
ncbi:tRNA wybutosine-synthesizing protein 3 like protein [Dictyocoela muelleri]|nr:tRNA wybutosine-synthesizing protein 3 like protein [Dictyocoela muelleri]